MLESKADIAYQKIKEVIRRTDPDSRYVYSENYFAEMLNMSRSPVRVALQRLQFEGFINISPHQGIVIRKISYEEAWQLMDYRSAVESFLMRRSIKLLTPADFTVLRGMIDEQRKMLAAEDWEAFLQDDADFHEYMYCHYDNPPMKAVVRMYKDRLYLSRLRSIKSPGRAQSSIEAHTAIVDALEAGDVDEAIRRMENHQSSLEKTMYQRIM